MSMSIVFKYVSIFLFWIIVYVGANFLQVEGIITSSNSFVLIGVLHRV